MGREEGEWGEGILVCGLGKEVARVSHQLFIWPGQPVCCLAGGEGKVGRVEAYKKDLQLNSPLCLNNSQICLKRFHQVTQQNVLINETSSILMFLSR